MKRVSRKAQSNSKFFGWLTDGASFGAQAGLVPFDDPMGQADARFWPAVKSMATKLTEIKEHNRWHTNLQKSPLPQA
jgi:hypothetical protein